MRPLRLELEGFGCYRERIELSFEGLSLFAVSGPTGSGKSTLIDAIVYALYGQVPRIGKQGVSEFINLDAQRMSVLLHFELEGATYRLLRRTRRPGRGAAHTEATLEKRAAGGSWRAVAGGASAVTERVEQLLGLKADAFLRCVVLPQGELATFLASSVGEQRKMLRALLRLEVYERMRHAASRERERLSEGLRALEARLAEDYRDASPERLAALGAEHARLATAAGRIDVEVEGARATLRLLEERGRLHEERASRERRRGELLAGEAAAAKARGRIEGHRRAAALLPLLEAHDLAERRRAAALADAASAERACLALSAASRDGERALAAAEDAAREVDDLEARLRAVHEAAAVAASRAKLRAALARDDESRRAAQATAAWEAKRVAAAEAARDEASGSLEEARAALEELPHDPARLARLERCVADAHRAAGLRAELGRIAAGREETEAEVARVARLRGAALARAEGLAGELAACEEALAAAAARVAAAEEGQHVHALREHLRTGARCPVCEQEVTAVPRAVPPASIVRARRQRDVATRKRDAVAGQAASLERDLGELDVRGELLAREAATLLERAEAARRDLSAFEDSVTAALEGEGAGEAPEVVHAALLEAARRLLRAHDEMKESCARLAAELREREHDAALHGEKARAAEAMVAALDGAIGDVRAELDSLDHVVLAAAPGGDLALEEERLESRRRQLLDAVVQARARAVESREDLARAEQTLAVRREQREREERARTAAAEARDAALAAAGLADEGATRAALIPAAELARLDEDLARRGEELAAIARRLEELDAATAGGPPPDPAALAAARARSAQVERERDATHQALAVAVRDLAVLSEQVKRAAELRARGAEERAAHEIQATLASDLSLDGFQEHLLAGTLQALVEGASRRLLELSGRYTLTLREGAIAVVDHDHAEQVRPSDTLSGGETFLAALALALELSSLAQGSAGVHRLDSLFIDEGFGTLDPETLDVVTGAIETLAGTDRLVGIVTHIDELSRRLPASIEVRRVAGAPEVETVRR